METIGAQRYAAEAAAHAASAYAAGGRKDAARRAATRCQELCPENEGGMPPGIEGLEPGTMALTARERQLVDLAARGLSNAEIAELLVLSVRTVESHLYRGMGKLGVANRQNLRGRTNEDRIIDQWS
jgi:DNA-binding NarL/FixJ family response regulator